MRRFLNNAIYEHVNILSLIFLLALGIYVEVRGRAHCIWTERCANVEENHVGSETYLEEKIYLIGGPSGKLKL